MTNAFLENRRAWVQRLCAMICLLSLVSTVLGQSTENAAPRQDSQTPSAPKPAKVPSPKTAALKTATIPPPKPATAFTSKPSSKAPAAADSSVEDRLRRMEEAYRRIEEANQKILGQYDGLLKKYDELKTQLKPDRDGEPDRRTSSTTRPASRVGAVEYQEPPGQEARQGMGAEGMGRRHCAYAWRSRLSGR